MQVQQFEITLRIITSISDKMQLNFGELLKLLSDFSIIYDIETEKLPYHINIIDELHADENAHSRIFAQLLRYKKNNKYPILEEFLNDVCSFTLDVESPVVGKVDSCGRIDIPIFDKNYVVLLENKVTDKAPDQNTQEGGQLARYIETIKNNYKRNEEDIFVVYTPKFSREPSDECWITKEGLSHKENFKLRFKSVSYRDYIYPWLKEKMFIFEEKDIYLQSAIRQYIDHLEGLFSLRTINKTMNIRLKEFLKEQLNLDDDNPYEAIDILSEKEIEMNSAIAQIQLLKTDFRKKIVFEKFAEWKNLLIDDFPQFKVVEDDSSKRTNIINLGIVITVEGKEFSALIECNIRDSINIYFGISHTYTRRGKCEMPESLKTLMINYNFEKEEEYWYGWRHTTINEGYNILKSLINEIIELD